MIAKTAFRETFGDSPRVKVIDFLLDNDLIDWSKSDMAEQTGISRMTLNKFFNELIKQKMIFKTRRIGRATLYKVNRQLPLLQKLLEIDDLLTKNAFEKEFGKHAAKKQAKNHEGRQNVAKIVEAVA
jgi:DNA-binding transcriptional regulator YhcF (GntR family)